MSIPEEVWNAGSHGNWQDDEKTIHQILENPPVADGFGVLLDADFYCRRRFADDGHVLEADDEATGQLGHAATGNGGDGLKKNASCQKRPN